MMRSCLILLFVLTGPAALHAQRGCPCPDSVTLFLQLDEPFRSRKLSTGTPWDVWPDGSYPDIQIKLKPSSKNYDCGPEGCDALCPGYFRTIELPRATDRQESLSLTLPGQEARDYPGCRNANGVCEEVQGAVGFSNVLLPNEPFHLFAVDIDLIRHDLIFEHADDVFRSSVASDDLEHVSSEPVCHLQSPNPANPFVSDCVLTLRGRRVGLVRIVKDPTSPLSYRKAPAKDALRRIEEGLRRDQGSWDYSYDAPSRVLIGTERYEQFFTIFEQRLREEQKQAAEPCDVWSLYRIGLKYSTLAGPLGFEDPQVSVGPRILEIAYDNAIGVYAALEGLAALAFEGLAPDSAGAAAGQLTEGQRIVVSALDQLVERDYPALLGKVSSAEETLEVLNQLDRQLGGALGEGWDYRSYVNRTRVQDLKTAVATRLMEQWRQSDLRGAAINRQVARLREMVADPAKFGKLGKVLKVAGRAAQVVGVVQSLLPPGFFSQEYQQRRQRFMETIRGTTSVHMGDMGFPRSLAWGDVLKPFQGEALSLEGRCLALKNLPASVCAGLGTLEPAPATGDAGASFPPSPADEKPERKESEKKPPEAVEKRIAACVADGLPLEFCRELQGSKP
jgi:hypothetical protein